MSNPNYKQLLTDYTVASKGDSAQINDEFVKRVQDKYGDDVKSFLTDFTAASKGNVDAINDDMIAKVRQKYGFGEAMPTEPVKTDHKFDERQAEIQGMATQKRESLRGSGKESQEQYFQDRDINAYRERGKTAMQGFEDVENLDYASNILKSAQQYNEAPSKFSMKAFKGLINQNWKDIASFGLNEMTREFRVLDIAKKAEKGEKLRESEQHLLDAYQTMMKAQEENDPNWLYEGMNAIPKMIPYIAQMIFTSGASTVGKKASESIIKKGIGEATESMVRKGTRAAVSLGVEAGVRTALSPHMIATDYARRMNTGEENEGTAVLKAVGNTYFEFFGEGSGDLIKKGVGALTGIGKKSGMNAVKTFAERFQTLTRYDGVMYEWGEEVLTELLQGGLLEGDVSSLADLDWHLSVLTSVGTIGGVYALANKGQRWRVTKRYQDAVTQMENMDADKASIVMNMANMDSPEEKSKAFNKMATSGVFTPEEKVIAGQFLMRKTAFDAMHGAKNDASEETANAFRHVQTDEMVGIQANGENYFVINGDPRQVGGIVFVKDRNGKSSNVRVKDITNIEVMTKKQFIDNLNGMEDKKTDNERKEEERILNGFTPDAQVFHTDATGKRTAGRLQYMANDDIAMVQFEGEEAPQEVKLSELTSETQAIRAEKEAQAQAEAETQQAEAEKQQQQAQQNGGNQRQNDTAVKGEAVQMPQFPVKKDGSIDYDAVEPNQLAGALAQDGFSEEEIAEIVGIERESYAKQLEEATKKVATAKNLQERVTAVKEVKRLQGRIQQFEDMDKSQQEAAPVNNQNVNQNTQGTTGKSRENSQQPVNQGGEITTKQPEVTQKQPEVKAVNQVPDAGKTIEQPKVNPEVDIKKAEAEAATSKDNDLPEPTEKQKEAGNYKMGHARFFGLDLTIENPKGSERKGVDKGGKAWSVTMNNTYGYIKGTKGIDKDHIDMFMADPVKSDTKVFIVDQVKEDGSFDEHKVMLGFDSAEEAEKAYLSNYEKGWKGLGNIVETNMDTFKAWALNGTKKSKPASEYNVFKTSDTERPVKNGIPQVDNEKYQKVINAFYELYNNGTDWTKHKLSWQASAHGKVVVDTIVYGRYPNGQKFKPEDYRKSIEELEHNTSVLREFQEELNPTPTTTTQTKEAPAQSEPTKLVEFKFMDGTTRVGRVKGEEKGKVVIESEGKTFRVSPENVLNTFEEESNDNQITETAPIKESKEVAPGKQGGESKESQETTIKGNLDPNKNGGVSGFNLDTRVKGTPVKNPSGNKLVTDERYQELLKRMKNKLNNLNAGIDPELIAIGSEMAVYHIEKGARKFKDYAKNMVSDIGEAVIPYLKSFYNAVRDMPQAESFVDEMTPYAETVMTTDLMEELSGKNKDGVVNIGGQFGYKIGEQYVTFNSKTNKYELTNDIAFASLTERENNAKHFKNYYERDSKEAEQEKQDYGPFDIVRLGGQFGVEIKKRLNYDTYRMHIKPYITPNGGEYNKSHQKIMFPTMEQAEAFIENIRSNGEIRFKSAEFSEEAGLSFLKSANTTNEEVTSELNELGEKYGVPVVMVNSSNQLPRYLIGQAKEVEAKGGKNYGVYDDISGKTYYVVPNLRDKKHARATFLHEGVAHFGLRKLLGEDFHDVLGDVYASMNPKTIEKYRRVLGLQNPLHIAEEYIAYTAEKDVQPSWFKRLVSSVRDIIRKVFDLDYTENDVHNLIQKSKRNLEVEARHKDYVESMASDLDNYLKDPRGWEMKLVTRHKVEYPTFEERKGNEVQESENNDQDNEGRFNNDQRTGDDYLIGKQFTPKEVRKEVESQIKTWVNNHGLKVYDQRVVDFWFHKLQTITGQVNRDNIQGNDVFSLAFGIYQHLPEKNTPPVTNWIDLDTPSETRFKSADASELNDNPMTDYLKIEDSWLKEKDRALAEANARAARYEDQIKRAYKNDKSGVATSAKDLNQLIYINLALREAAPGELNEVWGLLPEEKKALIKRAQKINQEARDIADQMRLDYQRIGEDSFNTGVIENIRENYVARQWDIKKNANHLSEVFRKFGTKTGHRKQRKLNTIFDGWAKGMELKIDGATENLLTLEREIYQTIENKRFLELGLVTDFADDMKLFEWGKQNDERYAKIDHPNFNKWLQVVQFKSRKKKATQRGGVVVTPANEETGKSGVIAKVELYAPVDVAKRINKILNASKLKGEFWDGATAINAALKSTILSFSPFHYFAFLRSYYFGGHIGSWRYNPIAAMNAGLEAFKEFGADVRLLSEAGLTIGAINEFDTYALQRSNRLSELLDKNQATKKAKDTILDMHNAATDMLFKKVGAGLKMHAALLELQALRKHHPHTDDYTLAKEVANLLNNDFGGLNLDRFKNPRNKTTQHLLRLLLLAPDWTESNIRTMIQATKGDNPLQTRMARQFWMRVATRGVMLSVAANLFMALLEPGDDDETYMDKVIQRYVDAWNNGYNWFDKLFGVTSVDVSPLLHMFDDQSLEDRAYFNLLGHFRDPIKFIGNPIQSAENKQSVILGMLGRLFSGKDWRGKPFTTWDEFLGIDDKGTYVRTTIDKETGEEHRAGDPKGGKLKGKLVNDKSFGNSRGMDYTKLPSYAMHEVVGMLPVPLQSIHAATTGEIHWFKAVAEIAGQHISIKHPKAKGSETMAQYSEVRKELLNYHALMTDKYKHAEYEKYIDLANDPKNLRYKQMQKMERVIRNINTMQSKTSDPAIVETLEARKIELVEEFLKFNDGNHSE